ncbi:MAG: hypothetical protein M1820_007285 [Bogoriella megaspora]|nr:MAG: hypothetical protein M1820_007285 [Bogoriella megaspora]
MSQTPSDGSQNTGSTDCDAGQTDALTVATSLISSQNSESFPSEGQESSKRGEDYNSEVEKREQLYGKKAPQQEDNGENGPTKDESPTKSAKKRLEQAVESDGRQAAIPELRPMSWNEWKAARGDRVSSHHYAIDMLCQEPVVARSNGAKLNRSTNANDQNQVSRPPSVKLLPERIRINSLPGRRMLDALVDNVLRFQSDWFPLILATPFKLLAHMEEEIRERLRELEADLAAKIADGASRDAKDKEVLPRGDASCPTAVPFSMYTGWGESTVSESNEATNDFRCLVSFIDGYINPLQEYLKDPQYIRFDELWYLFTPGTLLFVKEKTIPQKIWKVVQTAGGRKYLSRPSDSTLKTWEDEYSPFMISCYYVDFDGAKFLRVFRTFEIQKYHNIQSVSALPIVPLVVAEHDQLITCEELRERGEQFLQCTKPAYRYYQGRSLSRTPTGNQLEKPSPDGLGLSRIYSEAIESQVMVDFERTLQSMPDWSPAGDNIERKDIEVDMSELEDEQERFDDDTLWDSRIRDEFLRKEETKWQQWDRGEEQPSGDDLLLLPGRVFAFVLRTRSWACLKLGRDGDEHLRLRPVKRQDNAWDDLEIPSGHKDVIQSLIASHFAKDRSRKMDFDLIRDKGKGVIILLHGVPGVGKTSTAECVAESNNRPLLPITCGDLGLTPRDVECKLQTSFELAQAWDCILLLDEADIFLSQRTVDNIERNALVSVFLRVLEYYEGILFLTTNRVGAFDEAFKSRIHMALYYPPLSWQQTEGIWKSHIRRAQTSNGIKCDEDALLRYAERLFNEQSAPKSHSGPAWNGRQIRNAFQSAIALAKFRTKLSETIHVKKEHFEKVALVSSEFQTYLTRVQNLRTDGEIAKSRLLRDDTYGVTTALLPAPAQQNYFQDPQTRPAFRQGSPLPPTSYPSPHQQFYASANPSPFPTTSQLAPTPQYQIPAQQYANVPQQTTNTPVHQGGYYQSSAAVQNPQTNVAPQSFQPLQGNQTHQASHNVGPGKQPTFTQQQAQSQQLPQMNLQQVYPQQLQASQPRPQQQT